MSWPAELQLLAVIGADHPSLWGRLQVREPEPPLILEDAVVLPAWQHRNVELWWKRHSLGVYDRNGLHVEALSDSRGERRICPPPPRLEEARFNRARAVRREQVLYGGTLYDHFGHLLMDCARAYQLLREWRDSRQPIWFHDCTPHRGPVLQLPLVQQWLTCMGVARRVRIVRRPLLAQQLISGPALYSDRLFVSRDLRAACQAALKPKLRLRIERQGPPRRRLAYLSRHRLQAGSTRFHGEAELVERLADFPQVDVICPEDLDFQAKIALYRRYELVAGFPQSCMNLKLFAPGDGLARQVMFVAGPKSLSSSWVNIDRATGFGDLLLDCNWPVPAAPPGGESDPGFLRTNPIDVEKVLTVIRALAG